MISVCTAQLLYSANGHYYQVSSNTATWRTALYEAASSTYLGAAGHLVTITSKGEQDFVSGMVLDFNSADNMWVGGYDPTATLGFVWACGPEQGQSVTAGFNGWLPDSPSNGKGGAAETYMFIAQTSASGTEDRNWANSAQAASIHYVIEYECGAGSQFGANGCVTLYDGHYYQVSASASTWSTALSESSSSTYLGAPGHLVTITSRGEQELVHNITKNFNSADNMWIGGYDPTATLNFVWACGPEQNQPVTAGFDGWLPNSPSNGKGGASETYMYIAQTSLSGDEDNNWANTEYAAQLHYVVEYECNAGYQFGVTSCVADYGAIDATDTTYNSTPSGYLTAADASNINTSDQADGGLSETAIIVIGVLVPAAVVMIFCACTCMLMLWDRRQRAVAPLENIRYGDKMPL